MPSQVNATPVVVSVERSGDVAVVHCSGRLVAGVTDTFHTEIRQLIPNSKRIILDFKDLTHLDSTGIGALVRLYVSARSAGCTLEVANMGKSVRQLLGITHLLSMLESVGEHNIRMG